MTITQQGDYVGTYCVGDNLEARCLEDVPKGQSRTFTVNPGKGEPVTISVFAPGGGSAFEQIVTDGGSLNLDAAGNMAKPIVIRK